MAYSSLSQIKINNTTYDICDYDLRNDGMIADYYKINRTTSQKTIGATTTLNIAWDGVSSLSDKIYIMYLEYNTDSHFIYPVTLVQNAIAISNRHSSSISFTPTATQLWFKLAYS